MTSGRRRQRNSVAALAVLVAAGLAGGCGSSGGEPAVRASAPVGGYGAVTAEAAVIQFLDGAQVEDYAAMWSVFGTSDGSAVESFGVAEVEARMVVLSRLLKHDDYELRLANLVGLGPNRARYEVAMQGTRKGNVMVPFVTVHDGQGRWYVERLQADRLSGGGLN